MLKNSGETEREAIFFTTTLKWSVVAKQSSASDSSSGVVRM